MKKIELKELKKIRGGDALFRPIPGESYPDMFNPTPPPQPPCPPNTLIVRDGVWICPR